MKFKHWLNETELSPKEIERLGQKAGTYNFPTGEEWDKIIRPHLVRKSKERNPDLDPELTAYTPGETLKIMEHPVIQKWHDSMKNYKVPKNYKNVVLVSCAASKPWGEGCSSSFYQAYNQLKKEFPNSYFVTISEPLGIVPSENWDDFPQYDNPGLFKDTALQSGLHTKHWKEKLGIDKRIMPFDTEAYEQSIDRLSDVIAQFMDNNKDKNFISFVDDPEAMHKKLFGKKSSKTTTHGDMLDKASAKSGIKINRFAKKAFVPKGSQRESGTTEKIKQHTLDALSQWLERS